MILKKVDLGIDDKSIDGNKKISAMDMFTTKRVEGEPDLVALMVRDITNGYQETASQMFVNSQKIIEIKLLNPISQRIIINRWFTAALLTYRAHSNNTDVNEIMLHVINDGTVNDWKEQINEVVIPFFKINNVLGLA